MTKSYTTNSPRRKPWADAALHERLTVSNGFTSRALVICKGEAPRKKPAQQLARNVDVIVAADGGANVARTLGIRPDVIIGDLDSITPATTRLFASSTLVHVKRQDNTDLEKAFDFLLEHKIKRATIIAATGKRLDHTLGNLSVIWKYAKNIQLTFVGDGWTAIPLGRKQACAAKKGTTVSLVPFGVCVGITLKGLLYPLKNATMKVGQIGVSNVVVKSPFTVTVEKGKVLMIVLADYASVKLLS